jgi:hypothetical protein
MVTLNRRWLLAGPAQAQLRAAQYALLRHVAAAGSSADVAALLRDLAQASG